MFDTVTTATYYEHMDLHDYPISVTTCAYDLIFCLQTIACIHTMMSMYMYYIHTMSYKHPHMHRFLVGVISTGFAEVSKMLVLSGVTLLDSIPLLAGQLAE